MSNVKSMNVINYYKSVKLHNGMQSRNTHASNLFTEAYEG